MTTTAKQKAESVATYTTGDRLRALAQWFDEHPNAPVPYNFRTGGRILEYIYGDEEDTREVLRNIGSFDKEYQGDSFYANVKILDMTLCFYSMREKVCTKKVIGTRHVEAELIPARLIDAHDEEIVEWDCGNSVLSPDSEQ